MILNSRSSNDFHVRLPSFTIKYYIVAEGPLEAENENFLIHPFVQMAAICFDHCDSLYELLRILGLLTERPHLHPFPAPSCSSG